MSSFDCSFTMASENFDDFFGLQERQQELDEMKMRGCAVIPPILLNIEQRSLPGNDQDGLIKDPMSDFRDRQLFNQWTTQEKEIFKEKFSQHPKDFCFISSYLERKSVSDCVQHYYLTKKSENYKKPPRKHKSTRKMFSKQQPRRTMQASIV